MGPFSTDAVIEKLRSREVVVIDEIISPLGRWRYIRDEAVFAEAVDEIRKNLMNSREDTEVQSPTQSMSNFTPTPTFLDKSITAAPAGMDHGPIHGSAIRDAEFEEKSSNKIRVPSSLGEHRQYGFGDERELQSRVSRFSLLVWATALVLMSVAGWLFLRGKSSNSENDIAVAMVAFRTNIDEAQTAWRRGEFDLALSSYRKADLVKPLQPDVVTKLAPLMIQLEGETVAAKRLIQDALDNSKRIEVAQRSELNLALGLAALYSDDFDASTKHFKAALSSSPLSFNAGFNTAMASFMRERYAKAAQQFSDLGDDPGSLLMTANSLIESGTDGKKLKAADKVISRLLQRHAVFRLEALVLGAYVDVQSGNLRSSAARVISALEMDPDQTDEHWHDPILYIEPLRWTALLEKCEKVDEKVRSAATIALHTLCLAKAGKREKAIGVLDQELATRPDDPYLKAVNIYLLMVSGREDDARAALKVAEKSGSSVMTKVMRARLCQRKMDTECAEGAWADLFRQKPPILASLTGMAQIRLMQGRTSEALDLVNKAQMASPRYLPAMRLREEMK